MCEYTESKCIFGRRLANETRASKHKTLAEKHAPYDKYVAEGIANKIT